MLVLAALVGLLLPAQSLWAGRRVSRQIVPVRKTHKPSRPTVGSPDAPVSLWVFVDLQCPFSRRLVRQVLPRLVRAFAGKVRVQLRHFPLRFHRRALPAAIAVQEVLRQRGSSAAWQFVQLVFANQRGITDANLAAWAGRVGANPAQVTAALRSRRHRAAIAADVALAKSLGVRGTPSSFLFRGRSLAGGSSTAREKVGGAVAYSRMEARVRAWLQR